MPIINPTEDQLNEWLSQQTMRGTIRGNRLADIALSQSQLQDMQRDNANGGDPGVRFAAQPMNTIVNNSTGRVIDMNYATKPLRELTAKDQEAAIVATGGPRTKWDVHLDGPREISRRQLSDGTTEVIKEVPTLDGFGRQSSRIIREIETPDYLNPAALKNLDYQTKVANLQKIQAEARGEAKPKLVDGQWIYPPSQANPQGQAVPVGGFKKAPTEDERKTSYNVGRILQSAKMVQDIAEKDKGSLAPGVVEAAAGVVPLWDTAQEGLKNLSRSSNRQIVNQSQADIIDSLLFLATGAAYNKEQLAQQRASYQPNFTDSPEAVNAKNERMQGLIEAAKVRAGNAWTPEMDAALNVLSIPKMETGKRTSSGKIGGAPVTIRSDDDYARLPSGTVFTGPDGIRRRKP